MLIPLGTDRPLRRPTLTTYVLIGLNIALFLVKGSLERSDPSRAAAFMDWGVLTPPGSPGDNIWSLEAWAGFRWWTLISYAFLHANYWHIGGNMLVLYVFGPNIEDRFGRLWFLLFYLLGAVVSGAMQILFAHNPVIGASGAIAACTGAYLVMFPRTNVKAFFFLYGRVTLISAWWFIGFSIAMDLFMQGFGRGGIGFGMGGGDNVAHLAHLGGYGFGIVVALLLLGFKLIPREPYDLFTMGRQAYRRRQFRAAEHAAQQKVQQHWARAKGPTPEQQQEADALAAARADVVAKVNAFDLPAAAIAYKKLADTYANFIGGTTLSRRYQYDLANYFYSIKDHNAAVYAYERFLEAYPKDPDAGHIKLLLGMIHARALNDPIKAKHLITESLKDLDDSSAELARKELEALG